ncbi:LPS export ABC transporter permease LptF [Lutibaculum baratangense]|uniref:Putative Membrane protein n=1 Tax=Lutibaculum baratangense AMV1 TaxID=631454 RepID=V4RPL3_9HYPH|nr:LPS export ABC transporter permease LptF [Lutibaculum baratangense]ESR27224.1 putative Membrane protein [Lutibaculum baratangense AMV1]
MRLIERYIFRMILTGFVTSLVVLTGVVWVTQALREVDLLTSQGQTLWLFMKITMLALPALIMVIAPVALLIACLFTLNKFNADSELIVTHAAGASPRLVGRPFVVLALLVSVLTGFISLYLVPESAREVRNLITQIRADVLTDIVAPGRFTTVEDNLTFHIRERRPDGTLAGLLVFDGRTPTKLMTYLAEEGRIVRVREQAYLAMSNGSIQQQEGGGREISIVRFDNYVYDLSSLSQRSGTGTIDYHPREMRISELINPDPENRYYRSQPGRFRSELHERFTSILYPMVFVFISLAALGYPRTNRQGRGNSVVIAIVAATAVRTAGFAATNLASSTPAGVVLMYAIPLATILLAGWAAFWQQGSLDRIIHGLPTPAETLQAVLPPPLRRWMERRVGTVSGS